MSQSKIYLDYAAATPLLPEVRAVMEQYWSEDFGNPSAIHTAGRAARLAIESARATMARLGAIRSEGVIFTGSGTEANNLAIQGYLNQLSVHGQLSPGAVILTTKLEHPSLLNALAAMSKRFGLQIQYLPVDEVGLIATSELARCLRDEVVLVTLAYANSEIGVIQPVAKLARQIRLFNQKSGRAIKLHIDAAQAPWWLPYELTTLGADFLTLDAGKCGGPKGVGVLLTRQPQALSPIMFGGGQETGLRPGTEAVPLIVGAAEAFRLARLGLAERAAAVGSVRDRGWEVISRLVPEAIWNGPVGEARLPNNINLSLPSFDTEYATVYLDTQGVMVSTKSACAGAGGGVSAVVLEISKDPARARATLRLTLGPGSTVEELETFAKTLRRFLDKMK